MLGDASFGVRWSTPGVWVCGTAALLLGGCIVESGDGACSKNQMRVRGEGVLYCDCVPGYVPDTQTGIGCLPCGEHEESVDGECVCEEGYTRPSAGADCSKSALGSACSDDAACGGDVPLCADGYCTSECESSSDCERGWVCEEQEEGQACLKPPEGYGMSCESNEDCAGTEATHCETLQAKSCIVECSQSEPCPGDWVCCDIALAGFVICIPPDDLDDGACPAGGQVVTP